MKHTFVNVVLSTLLALVSMETLSAKAPKWIKKNRNAVCQVIAYDAQGNETGSCTGFFTGSDGDGVAVYDIFTNASKAVAIDRNGVRREILYITGANRIYDVVRFKVVPDKMLGGLAISAEPAYPGDLLYLLTFSDAKDSQPSEYTLRRSSEIANQFKYYTLSGKVIPDAAGAPLFNAEGLVVGVAQNTVETDTCNYALDSRFVDSLKITKALDLNSDNLRTITFPKSLPDNEEQALVYLYMNQTGDRDVYMGLIDRFIQQYPESPDGYLRKGTFLISSGDSTQYHYGKAAMETALAKSKENRDNTLFEYARLMYSTLVSTSSVNFEGWTLDAALEKANEALKVNEVPAYIQLQGNILYAMKRYGDALASYNRLNRTNLASPETYYYTSVIREKTGADSDEIIATLDSAVNFYGRPYTSAVSPYILERATIKDELGRYREAVMDLNEYEQIIGLANLTAEFHYFREQIEIKAKMYEQALNDIDRAVYLEPEDLGLALEKASLLLRVGLVDDALPLLRKLTAENPDNPDCNRLLGVCLMRSNDNASAATYLRKAKEQGDELSDQLLQQLEGQ